jgi:regulator of protease activity HflC (stomatin/prohibitin superfamily)
MPTQSSKPVRPAPDPPQAAPLAAAVPPDSSDKPKAVRQIAFWGLVVIIGLTVVTGTFIGLSAATSAYSRAQQRADAENRANLARIDIKRANELALVARAQVQTSRANAEKQYQEALGTRRAQQVISSGLTPQYLQYEAIQAQKAVATSGRNNTLIYLPSGRTGVPLVQDPQNVNRLKAPSGG